MGKEIERKFLIDVDKWNYQGSITKIKQGYLSDDKHKVIRIRLEKTFKDIAYITIKSTVTGISRDEFEYEIPYNDGKELIKLCDKVIEKTRYKYHLNNDIWEIDVFYGENEGLVIAEIELDSEDSVVYLPDWVIKEVTGDHKYYNSNLINNPYKDW